MTDNIFNLQETIAKHTSLSQIGFTEKQLCKPHYWLGLSHTTVLHMSQ